MEDFKEKVDEIFRDMKGRIKNPLILTFILVWCYFHWQFIFVLFYFGPEFGAFEKLNELRTYVAEQGPWRGMIGKPLIYSFISLAAFYLIANISQAIRLYLGKKLGAYLFAKIDDGQYELKSEADSYKRKFNKISDEYEKARGNLIIELEAKREAEKLILEKDKQLSGMFHDLELLRANEKSARNFMIDKEKTIYYLVAKANGLNTVKLNLTQKLSENTNVITGDWEGYLNETYTADSTGKPISIVISNNLIKYPDGRSFGEISYFSYEKGYHSLAFSVDRSDVSKTDIFHLIRIDSDNYIGFMDNKYIRLNRVK